MCPYLWISVAYLLLILKWLLFLIKSKWTFRPIKATLFHKIIWLYLFSQQLMNLLWRNVISRCFRDLNFVYTGFGLYFSSFFNNIGNSSEPQFDPQNKKQMIRVTYVLEGLFLLFPNIVFSPPNIMCENVWLLY